MTLPLSSAISMGDVNVELNKAATTPISLNDTAVRTLFIKQGDQTTISLGDGRGKSNIGAVTSLAVTPNTTTVLSTTVTWALPATGTVTKYEVYGKTAADTVTKQALQTFTTAPFPTTAALTGLKSGTAYTIYVTTSNASASTDATVPVTTLAYSFPFTAVLASEPNTLNTSAEVMVSGFPNSWPAILVSVASTTNAYFAVSQTLGGANNFTTSANTSGYYAASASGTLYVRVRFTSGTLSTTNTATLTVGDVTSVYSVTTRGADVTPSNTTPIIFTTKTDVPISTVIQSDMLTLSGLEPNYTGVAVSVTGGSYAFTNSAGVVIGSFTNQAGTGTVDATSNLYIKAQVTSAGSFASNAACTVTIGTATATFTTTTTTSTFTIAAKTGQTINTLITSATATVTGLQYSTSYTITVTGDTGFAVDAGTTSLSGTFGSSITVTSSATGTMVVAARVQSSTAGSTTTTCTVSIGTYKTGIFSVTTPVPDTSPVFDIGGTTVSAFTSFTDAPFNTVFTAADTIHVTSLEPNYGITISSSNGLYAAGSTSTAANSAAFTNSSSVVTTGPSGDLYIRARVTTDITFLTAATCTVTVGTGTITFSATTTTSTFSIAAVTNSTLNTVYTSATVTVTGLPYNATGITVTQPNGNGTVNAGTSSLSGTFATSKSSITASASGTIVVAVQLTSSTLASTAVTADISVNFTVSGTIYSKTSSYSVTTKIPITTPPTLSQFVFTAQTAKERSTTYVSNTVTLTGLEINYPLTISASGTNATVAAGQSALGTASTSVSVTTTTGTIVVAAYITTGTGFLTDYICTVTIGTATSDFKVTTRGAVASPTFSPTTFPSVTGQAINTTTLSSAVTITGLEISFPVAISVPGGGSYAASTDLTTLNSLTSSSFTSSATTPTTNSSGTIYIRAGATSSNTNLTTVTTRVYVGTGTIDFAVTTVELVPSSITLLFSGTNASSTSLSISAGAGSTPTSYYYSRFDNSSYTANANTFTATATASNVFTVSLPSPSTTYWITGYASVAGLTGSGNNSVTSTSTPPTSATISFASTTTSGTTITVTGNNTPTSYALYETNSNYTTDLTNALTPTVTGGNVYSITSKSNNTTYYYRATVGNTGGSANTTNSFTTTLAAPGIATITKGTITYNSVVLTFSTSGTNVGTPASYTLYSGTYSGDPSPTSFATSLGTNPTVALTASASAYTKYFTANAVNTAGSSSTFATYIQVDVPAQPPAAPSTISISFPSVTELGFTVRVNVGGGGTATQWYIQQYTNANYNIMTGNQLSSTSTNDFPLTGNSGTTYYFAGWASNGGGTATAAYNSVLLYPAAPSIAVGTVTYNSTSLTFTTSGGTPASYSVWYSTTNANTNSLVSLATDTTSNPVTVTLSASSNYYFIAKSKNATGSSGYGNFTSVVTTPAQPVVIPSSVTIAQSNNAATSFTITVSAGAGGAATSYTIKNYTDANYTTLANPQFSFTPNGATFDVTGLTQSSSYYIKGFAINAGGPGESGGNTYSTLAAAPTGVGIAVTTAATTTTVTLTVSSSSGGTPTSYWIEKYADSTYGGTPVTSASQPTGVFPLTGLTAGTPYYYKGVAATNSGASIGRSAGANPTFTTTALDTTPDAFSFTAVTGATLSSPVISSPTTLTGMTNGVSVPVSVTGGNLYWKTNSTDASWTTVFSSGNATTSATGTLYVELGGAASGSNSTKVTVTGTVGGVSGTFDITTVAAPAVVPGLSTNMTINKITNTGFTIKWDPPTTGGTPTEYYVSAQASGVFYYPAEGNPVSAPTTTATFTGLASNTQYFLGIVPSNSAGLTLNSTGFYVYPAVYYRSTTLAAGATFTYAFTAPTADTFYFTAEGISDGTLTLDTILNISAPTGTPKTWNNDDATGFTPSGRGSQIAITTVQGRVYTCKVTGFSTATSPYKNNGAFTFSISRTQSRG